MTKSWRTFSHLALALGVSLSCASLVSAQEDEGRSKFINPASVEGAAESAWSFSARSNFLSAYLYRGIEIYSGASIQPSFGSFYNMGEFGTIGASLWMHISGESNSRPISFFDESGNFIETQQRPSFFELDPTISYDWTYDIVTLSAGHIWYTDPGSGQNIKTFVNGDLAFAAETAPDSAEFYGGISLDLPGEPQFTVYHDYRALDYQYYGLSFRHRFETPALGEDFNLTPFVLFGFASNANDDKLIYNGNGLEHINIGISTTAKLGIFQVRPNLTYIFAVDNADESKGEFDRVRDKFVIGVEFAHDFGI